MIRSGETMPSDSELDARAAELELAKENLDSLLPLLSPQDGDLSGVLQTRLREEEHFLRDLRSLREEQKNLDKLEVEVMWPERPEVDILDDLRSCLWRLRRLPTNLPALSEAISKVKVLIKKTDFELAENDRIDDSSADLRRCTGDLRDLLAEAEKLTASMERQRDFRPAIASKQRRALLALRVRVSERVERLRGADQDEFGDLVARGDGLLQDVLRPCLLRLEAAGQVRTYLETKCKPFRKHYFKKSILLKQIFLQIMSLPSVFSKKCSYFFTTLLSLTFSPSFQLIDQISFCQEARELNSLQFVIVTP